MNWSSENHRWEAYEDMDITEEFSKVGDLSINKNKFMYRKYSIWKGLLKAVIGVVLIGLPVVINAFPEWMNLTIGGLLLMALNWAKFTYSKA